MQPGQNLVLTGFMGTGKTTVGRRLAKKLGMEFVDTDEVIEERHGTIASIFAEQGEDRFREIEREVARELGARTGLVIATGGRMVLDAQNLRELTRNGRIFCLVATPEEIHDRVTSDHSRRERPLLQAEDPQRRIVELLTEREHEYSKFAQLVTGHAGPAGIAEEVKHLWEGHSTYDVGGPAGGYAYTVGAGILPFVRQLAGIEGPMVVVTDDVVAERYAPSLGDVDLMVTVPAGRSSKTVEAVQAVYDRLFEADIDRSATIVSLGTSIIGDIAAFTAATYLRGVDLVHCPTNLIAMIDTSVGGKVGLDVTQGRNLIGLYKQPKAVLADVATLQTLPPRDFRSGLAEVLKHALLAGGSLLDRIEQTSWSEVPSLSPGVLAEMQSLVAQAIQVKIEVVREDPFEEKGIRTLLNLGHTFAYGIEMASSREIHHGEAVAMGMVAAARISQELGAPAGLADRVEAAVRHIGLDPFVPVGISPDDVLAGMRRDKKRRHQRQRLVLLRDIGDAYVTDEVTDDQILRAIGRSESVPA